MTNILETRQFVFKETENSQEEVFDVRTITIDDIVWWVAKDVADALNYSKTSRMLPHVDQDDKIKIDPREYGTDLVLSFGSNTCRLSLINESGLYTAIFGSDKKRAKEFKRWVTSEVLPEIRQTGNYIGNKEAQKPLSPGELLKLQAEAIIAIEQKTTQLEENQTKLERSQIELLVKQETTHAIAIIAQEKSSEALTIASTLQTQIDQLQEFILSSPPPLPQSIRNKLVEAMQTLGGILSANNVYEGFECYERPWRELGLAMRNSGYRYDLNARYEREKRAYQQRLEDWIAQGKQRGFKPKKYTRPDILERDNKLKEAYEGARLLARRYLSNIAVS